MFRTLVLYLKIFLYDLYDFHYKIITSIGNDAFETRSIRKLPRLLVNLKQNKNANQIVPIVIVRESNKQNASDVDPNPQS